MSRARSRSRSPRNERKSDEHKSDDRKGDDRKGDDRKSDDRKGDERKSDDRKSDDRKSGGDVSKERGGGSRSPRGRNGGGGNDGGSKRLKGEAARWNPRGFGFIKPTNGGEDVFCHVSSITDGNVLREGDMVEYEAEYDERKGKYRAIEVTGGRKEDDGGGRGGGGGFDRGGDRGGDRYGSTHTPSFSQLKHMPAFCCLTLSNSVFGPGADRV
jgi:cold shock CspA family protein